MWPEAPVSGHGAQERGQRSLRVQEWLGSPMPEWKVWTSESSESRSVSTVSETTEVTT